MVKFDVSMHFLVPVHIPLNENEENELFKKFSISKFDLPRIKHNDPAIASLKLKPGRVVKIERSSSLSQKVDYYRLVE